MEYDVVKQAYEHYVHLRDKRLELDRQSAEVKEQETEAKGLLLALMDGTEGAIINGMAVRPVLKDRPFIKDYAALREYILDTGNTQVFNRALNPKALAELGQVPGIEYFTTTDLSMRKTK
jgi:hypothetical protein